VILPINESPVLPPRPDAREPLAPLPATGTPSAAPVAPAAATETPASRP
jgi:hypothetical protein